MLRARAKAKQATEVSWAFETALGWMAIASDGEQVVRLRFGQDTREAAIKALGVDAWQVAQKAPRDATGWQKILNALADGRAVDIRDVPVRVAPADTFTGIVQRLCREIPWGGQVTYGQLAAQAGCPNGARAVGNVMRTNEIPLLIPCHRVVGTAGLGGYSAPGGLRLKRQLLELETAL